MNICLISREYKGSVRNGGIKSYIETVVQSLIKNGHRVTVICAADNSVPLQTNDNLRVIRVPFYDYYKSRTSIDKLFSVIRGVCFYDLYRILVALSFYSVTRREVFDFIEVPDYGAEAKYILLFKRLIAGKIVIRLHGASFMTSERKSSKWNWLKRRMIRDETSSINKVDVISSPSEFMKEFALSSVANIDKKSIKVIPNPILDYFLSLKQKKRTLLSNELKIGYVGTISHQKGVPILIDAVNSINAHSGNISCSLILAGRITRAMNEYIDNNNNKSKISYLGVLDKPELLKQYYDFDLVVIPSLREPFGLVALEALRTNGLVITSDTGALPEIINNEYNGLTFSSGCATSLEETILKITNMTEMEVENMCSNAYKSVIKYSSDAYCKKLESLLAELTPHTE